MVRVAHYIRKGSVTLSKWFMLTFVRIFFSALAQSLYDAAPNGEVQGNIGLAGQVLSAALERLYTYTRARPPSRTLVDPLDAFIVSLKEDKSWKKAAEAAQQAVENTKNLPAKAGRAAYVEQKNLADTPDPGEYRAIRLNQSKTAYRCMGSQNNYRSHYAGIAVRMCAKGK